MSDTASCCAEFYEQDWVAHLLGDNFHPGGAALTARLVDDLALAPHSTVLDVACGTGTTALALANRGHRVVAIDYSAKNVERAKARALEAGLDHAIDFYTAAAQSIPLDADGFDAVISECAFSTFANKPQVAAEMLRVLRPGGRLGISDMAVNRPLPSTLGKFIGPWACLQDALAVPDYQRLFLDAGFRVCGYVDESASLIEMAGMLKRRLVVVGLGTLAGFMGEATLDVAQARTLLQQAVALVEAGDVEYCRLHLCGGMLQGAQAEDTFHDPSRVRTPLA